MTISTVRPQRFGRCGNRLTPIHQQTTANLVQLDLDDPEVEPFVDVGAFHSNFHLFGLQELENAQLHRVVLELGAMCDALTQRQDGVPVALHSLCRNDRTFDGRARCCGDFNRKRRILVASPSQPRLRGGSPRLSEIEEQQFDGKHRPRQPDPIRFALRLDAEVVASDVQQFSAALKAGDLEAAVACYRGPLLDGFHIDDAMGFERWVDEERARLLRECTEAVKRLAKKAEIGDRWDAASGWWARAVELDRYNSRYVVRRMVALTRAGDRANAILEGEDHCRLLEEELELQPDESFLEELRRIKGGELGPTNFFTPGTRLDS